MSDLIRQHFYTRERRGLYKSTSGYDTVAKSPALPDAFVKEKIHPYCTYSGGGEKAITVAHFSCGRMLLGQAVHVSADFTRQRAAFFAHNYILPASMAGEYLSKIEELLQTQFETSYNADYKPEELKRLPTIPQNFANPLSQTNNLACRVINAIIKNKKTYIEIPKNITNKHEFACSMIIEIYKNLPDWAKHQLGFCTYATEPEKRKNIHLIFTDKKFHSQEGFYVEGYLPSTIAEKIALLSPANFLNEINFWYTRNPENIDSYVLTPRQSFALQNFATPLEKGVTPPSQTNNLIGGVIEDWLEKNLEKMSVSQFFAIPQDIIKRGKSSENPAIYTILEILKKISSNVLKNRAASIRYLLGSYELSAEDYEKVVKNLRRIYKDYKNPTHIEDIEFLFRERFTGKLNTEEFDEF
ncbi:MAG: hypothetical protein FWF81_00415 [Defluviitaleaceae bacterium]|nr:hypothetical protein [Defluviitaleaceae bacterium]